MGYPTDDDAAIEGLLYAANNSGGLQGWGYTPKTKPVADWLKPVGLSDSAKTSQLLQTFNPDAVGKQMVKGQLVAPDTFSWDSAFGFTDANGNDIAGWGTQGLGAASSLMGMYGGMEQLSLAKKNYALQKQAFEQNFNANRTAYNSAVANQWGRAHANGQTAMSESEYMAKYGLK